MAKQTIDIGTTYGDMVEPIRDGLNKCNLNFTEVYNTQASLTKRVATTQEYALAGVNQSVALTGGFLVVTPDTSGRTINNITGGVDGQEIVIVNAGLAPFELIAATGNFISYGNSNLTIEPKSKARICFWNTKWYI